MTQIWEFRNRTTREDAGTDLVIDFLIMTADDQWTLEVMGDGSVRLNIWNGDLLRLIRSNGLWRRIQ